MKKTLTETTFCSAQEACSMLVIPGDELWARVASGVIEAWDSADGRKLILRHSVQALREASLASAPAPPQQNRALRICLIEADHDVSVRYIDQLRRADATISLHVFDSVFEALLWIGANTPDLLIMDLQIPKVAALQLLQVLSQSPALAKLRIVIGTALNLKHVKSRGGLPVGVELFQKPIPCGDLEAIVRATSTRP